MERYLDLSCLSMIQAMSLPIEVLGRVRCGFSVPPADVLGFIESVYYPEQSAERKTWSKTVQFGSPRSSLRTPAQRSCRSIPYPSALKAPNRCYDLIQCRCRSSSLNPLPAARSSRIMPMYAPAASPCQSGGRHIIMRRENTAISTFSGRGCQSMATDIALSDSGVQTCMICLVREECRCGEAEWEILTSDSNRIGACPSFSQLIRTMGDIAEESDGRGLLPPWALMVTAPLRSVIRRRTPWRRSTCAAMIKH